MLYELMRTIFRQKLTSEQYNRVIVIAVKQNHSDLYHQYVIQAFLYGQDEIGNKYYDEMLIKCVRCIGLNDLANFLSNASDVIPKWDKNIICQIFFDFDWLFLILMIKESHYGTGLFLKCMNFTNVFCKKNQRRLNWLHLRV